MTKALAPHLMASNERTREISQILGDACIRLINKKKKQDSTGVARQTERSCKAVNSTKKTKYEELL